MENTFVSYEKAQEILDDNVFEISNEKIPLELCNKRVLTEDLIADRDFPPYNRVTMDGIAFNYSSYQNSNRDFVIESVSAAGTPEPTLNNLSSCIEVMTGSMLPVNCDTVIRYEDLTISKNIANIKKTVVNKGQNIHKKGSDINKKDIIVTSGCKISSAEINIAAAVGKKKIQVAKLPNVIVISTGDELVDIAEKPLPFQIRRSNVYGIQNSLEDWGLKVDLGHLSDDKLIMQEKISSYLKYYDLLIFTGGVSKGKFDFLPDVLQELKVVKHFYKIQQRPGKPFWFGSSKDGSKIFALPGNPVSSFVCLNIYVKYWIDKSLGLSTKKIKVELLDEIRFDPNLVYFPEAKLYFQPNGSIGAKAILGNGSGDFVNLVNTDGFLILPQERKKFRKGEIYEFVPYRKL